MDKEGGEEIEENQSNTKDEKPIENDPEEGKSTLTISKSNTQVKLSTSARLKRKLKEDEPPDSPLPVIYINNKDNKMDQERTDEQTPHQDHRSSLEGSDEEGPDTSRQFMSSKKSKKKKKLKEKTFVNLKSKYDGFNKLRFVYSRVIPK